MNKNGEVYQIAERKYLIVSNKGNYYIGCILSDNDRRKRLLTLAITYLTMAMFAVNTSKL